MQHYSLEHLSLLPSPIPSTTGCCFCFDSVSSFFLEFLYVSDIIYLSFSVSLHSVWQSLGLSMHMAFFLSFLWLVFHCIYVWHHLYPFLCWWTLGCCHRLFPVVLAIVNIVAVNIGVHVLFQIMVLSAYMPRNGGAGTYCGPIFCSLRSFHTVLHSGCTSLYAHQPYKGFPSLHTFSSFYCL